MPTVDHLIQRYCECARSTWNNYLRPGDADETAVERYEEVRAAAVSGHRARRDRHERRGA